MRVLLARGLALSALTLVWLIAIGSPVSAGTTGKITGTVVDASNGEPLPGANVIVEGTTMGAMTDIDGSFFIINVPPGAYNLKCEFIGFTPARQTGVEVNVDRTTEASFKLQTEALEIGVTIVVEAEIPIIKPDITASVRTLTSDRLATLPVKTVQQALETNVGFVTEGGVLHVRGGRSGEVLYLVDGMPISDPLVGGGQAIQVSSANIRELEILAGGFNAEYGSAQSAIINIVTKEGNVTEYHGHVEYLTDDLTGTTSEGDESFNSDRVEMSLSGPEPLTTYLFPNLGLDLPGKNISFYLSMDMDKRDSWVNYEGFDYGTHEYFGFFDLSERRINDHTATAKLTWWLRNNLKFALGWNKSWSRYTGFAWDHRYVPEFAPYVTDYATNVNFNVNHTLSRNLFYELNVSRFTRDYERTPGGRLPDSFHLETLNETYSDRNANGQWDPAEPYTDTNGDGEYDAGEPYVDVNGNGQYDAAEPLQEGEGGNGVYDPELRDWTNVDRPEPFVDAGEPFDDYADGLDVGYDLNGNGQWDPGEPYNDDNYNGQYDAANGEYDPGEQYTDLNANGEYDGPNGVYDEGETFYDVNGNGTWDDSDQFFDWGTDRWGVWHNRILEIWTTKTDVTWAPNPHHTFKTGVELRFMSLTQYEIQYVDNRYTGAPDGGPYSDESFTDANDNGEWDAGELYVDANGNGQYDVARGVFRDNYDYSPTAGSFYLQDKMEYGQLIANIGLRLDGFRQVPVRRLDFATNDLAETQPINTFKVSPRMGISYPITRNAKVYFSYGHFYQLPELQYMYESQTQGASAANRFGNPELDYEKTIAYEFGVDYAFMRDLRVDVKGFYKDIYGLVNLRPGRIANQQYQEYYNGDYGRVRGVEVTVEKAYSNYFSLDLSYMYSFSFGKSSSATSNYYDNFYGRPISIREWPLNWDQRHQVTASLDVRAADGDHPDVLGLKLPDNWGLNFLVNYGSGFPYTPAVNNPAVPPMTREEQVEPNSLRRPWTMTVDMRFNKDFGLWGIDYSFILWVDNLFNKRNVRIVHAATGRPDTSVVINGVIGPGSEYDHDPANYDAGRNVRVGFALRF